MRRVRYEKQHEMVESFLDIVNKLTISAHGKYTLITTGPNIYDLCYDVDNGSKDGSFKRYIILNGVSMRILYYTLIGYLRMGIVEGVFIHDYDES